VLFWPVKSLICPGLAVLCSAWLLAAPDPELSTLGRVLSGNAAKEFARATSPRAFQFPRDHGPHPEFRHEWWYVTGHLNAAAGQRFGFELTFFRLGLAPPRPPTAVGTTATATAAAPGASTTSAAAPAVSNWRARQIYVAHFAVTDIERQQFHVAERRSREALGLAGASHEPLAVWVDDWKLSANAAGTHWHLVAASSPLRLELDLEPLKAPVANGERGLSRKSADAGNASYYYSVPRLAVRGTLDRDARALAVSGSAWLDREWGTTALTTEQAGWDWFALQFEDGTELMFYALRRRDGSRDPISAGTWIERDGKATALAAAEVEIDVLKHWDSPRGGRYPAQWRLRLPRLALEVEIRPLMAAQELDTTPRYWEGAVDVNGLRTGKPIAGRGYVELTGYARSE
jgi:predicted secreted hydrolase